MEPPENQTFWDKMVEKLSNSRFFTISFVFHVLLIILLGSIVLFEAAQEPADFEGSEGGFLAAGDQVAAPPPAAPSQPKETTFTVSTPTIANNTVAAITTTAQNPLNFTMDAIVVPAVAQPTTQTTATTAPPTAAPGASGMTAGDSAAIGAFTGGWGKKGSGSGTGTRQREFAFTAYIAKYDGGNWNSTVDLTKSGEIWRGSLPNLLEFMSKESKDKIKTDYKHVEAIDLGSDKIFATKPPFIFFTGSKDFVLKEAEVQNLRKYVRMGGAIWGDSSVPGRGSAFDIAFRREMKRVMPDKDKDFEPLRPDDPVFRKNPYFTEVKEQPSGLNYYDEPVYVMRIFGEVAIIYTANDYGDMLQFGVKQEGKGWVINNDRDEHGVRVALDWRLYINSGIYVHNTDPNPPMTSIMDTYKFGTNMVIHLLTRWEDKVRAPANL